MEYIRNSNQLPKHRLKLIGRYVRHNYKGINTRAQLTLGRAYRITDLDGENIGVIKNDVDEVCCINLAYPCAFLDFNANWILIPKKDSSKK